jgi:Spy/CpxP family protein refolding chaperone
MNNMKKISVILSLVFVGFAVQAQTTGNGGNMSDTSHHYHAYHNWNHNRNDSLNRGGFRNFNRDRSEAMNRFDRGGRNERFHRFGGRNRFIGEMAKLHFSPEQHKQMQAIDKEYHQKSADLYKNDKMTLGEYKMQLASLQKEKKYKLQALLTPEQKDNIAQWKKQREENIQVKAAARLERMKIRLKLTDQQAATIKTQEQNTREQMKSIHENENLASEQKREQIKTLMAKQKDAIKSVLTPEQATELENMHKHRFGAVAK